MSVRLLIADDHPWVREGLRLVFSNTGIDIVAEADSGTAAVERAMELDVDVVLLDITMPGSDGIESLRRIKAVKPQLPVLVYSARTWPEVASHCAALGASGYLVKGVDNQTLVSAVKAVGQGQEYWGGEGRGTAVMAKA